jgi:Holliday junction DNA helicase RuvA
MISHLRGTIDSRIEGRVVIEAGGVGYEVFVAAPTLEKLPPLGAEAKLYIVESSAMYGGATSLYGFGTLEERDIFTLLREHVPGAGAKKALEYLDKISKSLPDFSRAIELKDADMLVSVFGFTKKTADKLISALKDKLDQFPASSEKAKWVAAVAGSVQDEAVSALVSLGFKPQHARSAVEDALAKDPKAGTEALIRNSLQYLSGGK